MHLKLNMPLKELPKFSADFFSFIASHVLANGSTIRPVPQAEEQRVVLETSAGLTPHMPSIGESSFPKMSLICFLLSISTTSSQHFLDYCDCLLNLSLSFCSCLSTILFSQQQKLPLKINLADHINFLPKTYQWLYNTRRTKSQLLTLSPCRTELHLLASSPAIPPPSLCPRNVPEHTQPSVFTSPAPP